jgi:nucleotidyltransferase substrate binding protein (TIGR01987 family)
MKLNISSLEKAIKQLETTLGHAESSMAADDRSLFESLRAGAIQTFEFTYELSWKTMKRFIEMQGSSESETEAVKDFNDLLRMANEYGLIRDVKAWFAFRKERNITSHTYDFKKAAEVYAIIPGFLKEVVYLRDQIKKPGGSTE